MKWVQQTKTRSALKVGPFTCTVNLVRGVKGVSGPCMQEWKAYKWDVKIACVMGRNELVQDGPSDTEQEAKEAAENWLSEHLLSLVKGGLDLNPVMVITVTNS